MSQFLLPPLTIDREISQSTETNPLGYHACDAVEAQRILPINQDDTQIHPVRNIPHAWSRKGGVPVPEVRRASSIGDTLVISKDRLKISV